MKRLAAVIICSVLMAVSLTGCADKVWERTDEYENGGGIIVSPEGVRYRHGTAGWHIVGFKTDKKLGHLPYTANSKKGEQVCSIKGADSEKYIAVQDTTVRFSFDAMPEYSVFIRSGEDIDYTNTDISEVAFIPIKEDTDDYSQYVKDHGLFGDEAKAAMQGIYDNESEFAMPYEVLGNIVYRQAGLDWCYFMAFVRYSHKDGYFIIMKGKYYSLPENTLKALGISYNES